MRASTRGLIAIIGACLSICAGNLMSKDLLARVEPLPLVFVQVAGSAFVLWGVVAIRGRWPGLREAPRLAIPGLFQPGFVFTLSFAGLTLIPLSIASFLYAFETLLVLLIAWPALGERPDVRKLGLAVLGFAGVVLLSSGGALGGGGALPAVGLALVMGSVLAAALHTVSTRALAPAADPTAMAAVSLVGGLAIIAPALLIWPPARWGALLDAATLAQAIAAGLLLHGAAMLCFNVGLARVAAGTVAILLPAIAPVTAAAAFILFGERPSTTQWAGGAMILAAAIAVGLLPERVATRTPWRSRPRGARGSPRP